MDEVFIASLFLNPSITLPGSGDLKLKCFHQENQTALVYSRSGTKKKGLCTTGHLEYAIEFN